MPSNMLNKQPNILELRVLDKNILRSVLLTLLWLECRLKDAKFFDTFLEETALDYAIEIVNLVKRYPVQALSRGELYSLPYQDNRPIT